MSSPIDLSVTGIPSPRIDHPRSGNSGKGRSQTPLNVNRARSLHSDVFTTAQEYRKTGRNRNEGNNSNVNTFRDRRKKEDPVKDEKKCSPAVKFDHCEEPSPSIITKSKLESIQQLTASSVPAEEAEQVQQGVAETSRKPAPDGVPVLSLGDITGNDDDLTYTKIADDEDDDDGISQHWAVPSPTPWKTKVQAKGGGWQVAQSRPPSNKTPKSRRPDDVPELDLNLSQSNVALGKLKETVKKVDEDLQIEYIGKLKGDKELDNLKKLSREKKNQLFEEAILAEQLSNVQVNKSTSSPYDLNQRFDSRVRRHNDLYSSSTVTIGQNGNIDKRLQFSARILTLNGHDARRELSGFFITADNTIAMYEFRQFGTRSKALPFIQRAPYRHLTGHRKGECMHLMDIKVGKDLVFDCESQPSVPDSLKKMRKCVTIRITEVDEENKNTLLFDKCKNDKDRKDVYDFIHFYNTRERTPELELLHQVQCSIQDNLVGCIEKILTNFFHQLESLDVSCNGFLKKELYRQQLHKFRIPIDDEAWDMFWNIVDKDASGVLDYGEFMRQMFGEMSEQRKLFVRKAFSRLDPNKRGVGEVNDIRKYFLPSKHPRAIKGEVSESELLDTFVQCFKCSKQKNEISFSEFEVYYEGVSVGITSDQSFINLLRMTWNI